MVRNRARTRTRCEAFPGVVKKASGELPCLQLLTGACLRHAALEMGQNELCSPGHENVCAVQRSRVVAVFWWNSRSRRHSFAGNIPGVFLSVACSSTISRKETILHVRNHNVWRSVRSTALLTNPAVVCVGWRAIFVGVMQAPCVWCSGKQLTALRRGGSYFS